MRFVADKSGLVFAFSAGLPGSARWTQECGRRVFRGSENRNRLGERTVRKAGHDHYPGDNVLNTMTQEDLLARQSEPLQ